MRREGARAALAATAGTVVALALLAALAGGAACGGRPLVRTGPRPKTATEHEALAAQLEAEARQHAQAFIERQKAQGACEGESDPGAEVLCGASGPTTPIRCW